MCRIESAHNQNRRPIALAEARGPALLGSCEPPDAVLVDLNGTRRTAVATCVTPGPIHTSSRVEPAPGIAARRRLRPPYRGRIRVPIRGTAVRPIGPIERITGIAIRARWWANVSPHASASGTMPNLSAISVSTSLPLRHPSKIRGRRRGNYGKAQGRACQQTGNKLLHCNPRYGESEERTLHVGAPTSMAPQFKFQRTGIEARYHSARAGDATDLIGLSRSSSIVCHFVSGLADRGCGHPKRPDSAVGKPVVVGMDPSAR